jgi:DNA-directed RNA polymerase subunit N (RpoN/RPB10)
MIIPIRCFECGKVIGDQWVYYQAKLKEMKANSKEDKVYFDGKEIKETPEKKILDSLGLVRACCRTHFLTQVDLLTKI